MKSTTTPRAERREGIGLAGLAMVLQRQSQVGSHFEGAPEPKINSADALNPRVELAFNPIETREGS